MKEGEWQDANIGQQAINQLQPAASEADLTTDDLVFMVGEYAVQGKGKDKINKYQGRIIQAMQVELGKLKSQIADRDALVAEIEALKKSADGKDTYIRQLETDCHAIAVERDGLKKEIELVKVKKVGKKDG